MSIHDQEIQFGLRQSILLHAQTIRPLPGISDQAHLLCLLEQLVESVHRVRFISAIKKRHISPLRADPNSDLFHPLKAAIIAEGVNDIDEACWLVFLFVHFGKHKNGGWRYSREVYGRLGGNARWSWREIHTDVAGFRQWLDQNQATLKRPGAGFGNHRKYESFGANNAAGTGSVVESYVDWINSFGSHQRMFQTAREQTDGSRGAAFNFLYSSMKRVRRFGRLARFDYLAMLGKLELAPIEPDSAYLVEATGPYAGAKLLFGEVSDSILARKRLDALLAELNGSLNVGFQVLEDALCNWAKSPGRFEPFRS